MNSSNKRIAKNTLMLYIRMILITLVSLYTSRIVLNILGFDDFGIYNVVGGIVVMLGFLNSAMSSATQRFLSYELGRANDLQLRRVFSTSINIHIIIAIAVVVLAETVGLWFLNNKIVIAPDRIAAAQWVYQFSVMTFVLNVLSVPYNAMIISHERMSVFAYVSIAEVILKLGIVYMLTLFTMDKLELYAILMFAVSLLIRIIYQIYCTTNFTACKYKFEWNVSLIKEMLSFAGWSLFGGFAYIAKIQGVNVVLNLFFGTIVNAAYGIAQQISSAVLVMISNFTLAINPPIVKSHAKGTLQTTYTLLFSGMRYSFVLTAFMIFPLLLNTKIILSIWLGKYPDSSVVFSQLMLIIALTESIIHPIASYIQATGKVKIYQSVIGIILLLILPFSYLALKIVPDPNIVLYVSIFMTIIAVVARFLILYKYLRFSMKDLWFVIQTMLSISLANTVLYIFTKHIDSSILSLFTTSIISIVLTLCIFVVFGMKNNERTLVFDRIMKFSRK